MMIVSDEEVGYSYGLDQLGHWHHPPTSLRGIGDEENAAHRAKGSSQSGAAIPEIGYPKYRQGQKIDSRGNAGTSFTTRWRESESLMTRSLLAVFAVTLLAVTSQTQAQRQSIPDSPTPRFPVFANLVNGTNSGQAVSPDSIVGTGSAVLPVRSPVMHPPMMPESSPTPLQSVPNDLIEIPVNHVILPVVVRDSKHNPVAGLTLRDFEIFEDGVPQQIRFFTTDPLPLSLALVVDQSLPRSTMQEVNESLNALPGALSSHDEIAVFTYNKFVSERTALTAAHGQRIRAVLARARAVGRATDDITGGPLTESIVINGQLADPNLAPQRGNLQLELVVPKEDHPLSDAILEAAKALAKTDQGRRRILYVISDGKDAGSRATWRGVVRYLSANDITVYATLVGDSATPGLALLNRVRLPFVSNNILPKYTKATGGTLEPELSTHGIETSFEGAASLVRSQYLIGFYSHTRPAYPGRTTIDVRTPGRPGLQISARRFYDVRTGQDLALGRYFEAPRCAITIAASQLDREGRYLQDRDSPVISAEPTPQSLATAVNATGRVTRAEMRRMSRLDTAESQVNLSRCHREVMPEQKLNPRGNSAGGDY